LRIEELFQILSRQQRAYQQLGVLFFELELLIVNLAKLNARLYLAHIVMLHSLNGGTASALLLGMQTLVRWSEFAKLGLFVGEDFDLNALLVSMARLQERLVMNAAMSVQAGTFAHGEVQNHSNVVALTCIAHNEVELLLLLILVTTPLKVSLI
jgi:hypothetical protein